MTSKRLIELQALLGIVDQDDYALETWEKIERARRIMRFYEDGRRTVPDAQKARRHLAAIDAAARKLAKLVGKEPLARLLFSGGTFPGRNSDDGWEIISPSDEERRAFEAAPREFIERLDGVATVAQRLAEDKERFRLAHCLLDASQGAQNVTSAIFWPMLFWLWKEEGKKLSHTEDGPLHNFLKFVHRELGLAEPSASTLRDAIAKTCRNASKKS